MLSRRAGTFVKKTATALVAYMLEVGSYTRGEKQSLTPQSAPRWSAVTVRRRFAVKGVKLVSSAFHFETKKIKSKKKQVTVGTKWPIIRSSVHSQVLQDVTRCRVKTFFFFIYECGRLRESRHLPTARTDSLSTPNLQESGERKTEHDFSSSANSPSSRKKKISFGRATERRIPAGGG